MIYENMFIFIIIPILAAGFLVVRSFKLSAIERFRLSISFFGSISAILVSFSIYMSIKFNGRNVENQISQNTLSNVQFSYLSPQKELLDRYPEGYFLYAEMNQDTALPLSEPKNYDPVKQKQVELYQSIRVFQAVEDFLSFSGYDISGIFIWLNNFLGWMQSPTLQKNWGILEFNFYNDTRELMPKIIEKANELIELRKKKGKLTTADYDNVSKSIIVNNRSFAKYF